MTDECIRVTQTDLNRVTETAPRSTLTVASAAEMTDFDLACVASKAGVLISLLHWATGILAKAPPVLDSELEEAPGSTCTNPRRAFTTARFRGLGVDGVLKAMRELLLVVWGVLTALRHRRQRKVLSLMLAVE